MNESRVEERRFCFYIASSLIVILKNEHRPTNTCLLLLLDTKIMTFVCSCRLCAVTFVMQIHTH
jgi:hypothetical protein